jgi:hypothetical protein
MAQVNARFPAGIRIMAEPGRGMVAEAGMIAAEVLLVARKSEDDLHRWVYLDIGKFSGLAETMDEAIRYQFITPHDGEATGPCILAGPSCDSADVLYEKRPVALPLALKAGDRLRVIMDLCYLTGQRIGDVLAIRRADLTDDGIAFKQEKTGKRLIVAWTPELRRAVESAKSLTRHVTPLTLFYAKGGKTPGYKIIWRQWKTACKLAGVANANIHDLRALSGTDADRQGIDAQALLGHTDPKMTRRYLRDRSAKVVSGPRVDPKRNTV